MSKLSIRARALDAAKPLLIYHGKDIPDLKDCVTRLCPRSGWRRRRNRNITYSELFQRSKYLEKKKREHGPSSPPRKSSVNCYHCLYKGEFKQPIQFIHIRPFNLDNEQPDYDMDSEDETLLNRLNRKMESKPL